MRKNSRFLISLVATGCLLFALSFFITDHVMAKSLGFRWMNVDKPVKFNVSLDSTWKNSFVNAMGAWNNVSSKVPLSLASPSEGWDNDVYIVSTSETWIAKMFPQHRDGYIGSADIRINNSYQFANGAVANKYDQQSVLTHELGHAIGIAHCHEQGETHYGPDVSYTMYNYSYPDTTAPRSLEQYDKDAKNQIYGK